jgi:predicted ester cyclase
MGVLLSPEPEPSQIRHHPASLCIYSRQPTADFAALPDLHLTIEAMIAEGDLVATLLRATDTHQGEWHGIAPSHKPVVQPAVVLSQCADGKLVEAWEGERSWAFPFAEVAQA